jgi:hypothetical protein
MGVDKGAAMTRVGVSLKGHGSSRKKHVEDVLNAWRHLCGVVDRFVLSMVSMQCNHNAQQKHSENNTLCN